MAVLDIEVKTKGATTATREIKSLDEKLNKASAKVKSLENVGQDLEKQLSRLSKASKTYESDKKNLTKALNNNIKKIQNARISYRNTRVELDSYKDTLRDTSNNTLDYSKALKGLIAVYGVLKLKDFTLDIINAGREFESLTVSLNAATGGFVQGAQAFDFLRETTSRLGTDLVSSIKGFKELSASAKGTGIDAKATQDIFTAVAEASSVMQLSVDDTNGTFRALSQIMSKGTVQAEELRGQLGERIPGAFQIASRAMGVTTQELGKMLEQGQVISDEFLPKFAEELKRTFSKDVENSSKTLTASINRFNNELSLTSTAIAESGLNELAQIFTDVGTSFLDTIRKFVNAQKSVSQLKTIKDLEERLEGLNKQQEQYNNLVKTQPRLSAVYNGYLSRVGETIFAVKNKLKLLNAELEESNKKANGSGFNEVSKTLLNLINPIDAINVKYTEYREQLKGTAYDTEQYIKVLETLKAKEIEALDPISNSEARKALQKKNALSKIETPIEKVISKYEDLIKTFDKLGISSDKNLGKIADSLINDLSKLGKNQKIEFDIKINGISEAKGHLSKVIGTLDDMQKNQNKYNKFLKQTGNTEKELAEAKALYGENQINGIQSLASASKTFFDEESTAYMTLMALETALSVQKGLTAIANAMAKGDGYTAVARGLAVASSLNSFGIALSGGGASSPESQARQEYDNFSDAVDKMVDALEEFGNQGTATATVLESNLAKIASLQVAKEQANYNITSRYREEFNDYLTGGRYGGTRYIAQRPTSEAGVADVTGQINSTIDYTLSLYRDAVSDELRKSIAEDIDYSLVSEDYILAQTGLSDFTDFSNQFTSMQEGLSQIGLKVKEMSRNFASESEINSYLNNGKVLIEGIGSLSAVDIYTSDIYKAGIDYEEAIENINELREEEMQTLADLAEATKEADKSIQDTINSILGLSGAYDDDTEFKRLSEFNRLIAEYGSTTGEDKADVLDDILSLSTILSSNSNIQGAIVSRLQGLQSTSDSQILSDVVSAEAQTLELEQASNLELEKVNANLEENNINTLSLEQRMRNIEDLLLQLSNGGQSLKMEMVG